VFPGMPQVTKLGKLKASARNCNVFVSTILKFLSNAASSPLEPGPWSMLRPLVWGRLHEGRRVEPIQTRALTTG
jgi:hypothetical protein